MTETQTISNVRRYLAQTHGSVWNARLTDAQFFWNDELPLYEMEISSADGRRGYALVSNSERLPFVISRSTEGGLLSSMLRRRLFEIASAASAPKALPFDNVRFQYVVPFTFLAHLADGTVVQLDDGVVSTGAGGVMGQAVPRGPMVEPGIAREWAALGGEGRLTLPLAEITHPSGPYYNQAYNGSCVISGCVAVAWAAYAGWLKGSGGLLPKLFDANDCWYDDWGSYWRCMQPTNECKAVDDLIWWFNQVVRTVNGATKPADVIRGSAIFGQFGSPQVVMRPASPDVGTITSLMQHYAVLFCGVRDWQFMVDAPDKLGTLYDAPAGHCVVAHGIKENEIYVNMGWGEYTKSRWFNLNAISQSQVYGLYNG